VKEKDEKNKEVKSTEEPIENNMEAEGAEGDNIPTEVEITKVIIVDFTAFNSRSEKVFFGKRMEEVKFELLQHCNTTVIHKTTEYDLSVR
jgi:hypothetical protein